MLKCLSHFDILSSKKNGGDDGIKKIESNISDNCVYFMSEFIFEDRAAWVTDINGNSSKINRRGEVVLPFAVLAVYDSHNILVGNEIKTLESFEDGETQTVVFDLDSTDTQRIYRLFIWDSLQTMRPVSVPVDIEQNE